MLIDPPDRPPQTPNEWGILVVLGFFFGLFLVADLVIDASTAKLSVPFFLISWVALLLLHEAGHALMAAWLGWKVERISIGTGRVRWRTQQGQVEVEFRTIPLSGHVIPRPVDLRSPRLKHFLIYAAGPGIELLAVGLCLIWIGPDRMMTGSEAPAIIAVQAFSVAAVFGAVLNLIPLSHPVAGGMAWSDGMGMIRCWFLTDEVYRRMRDGRE